jgi:hypothetical protein
MTKSSAAVTVVSRRSSRDVSALRGSGSRPSDHARHPPGGAEAAASVVDALSGTPAHARRCGPCGEPAAGRCWQTPNVASPACAPRCRRSSAPPPELGPPSPSACSPSPRARLRPRGGPGRDLGSLRRGQGRRRCQGSRFRFSCLSRCGRLRARRRCPPHRSHGRARSGMLDLSPPTEENHMNDGSRAPAGRAPGADPSDHRRPPRWPVSRGLLHRTSVLVLRHERWPIEIKPPPADEA